MKVHRLNFLVALALILTLASILSISAFSVVSAVVDPRLIVNETDISTKASTHNYVTGSVSYADGQRISLYDENGSEVGFFSFEESGINKNFYIEIPELSESITRYYVAQVGYGNTKDNKPVAVTVRYNPPKKDNDILEDGTNARLNEVLAALCWPEGTGKSQYQYSSGSPKEAYVEAAQKMLGSEVGEVRKGKRVAFSDCGYFVSTVIRMTGVDPKFRALRFSYADKNPDWFVVYEGSKVNQNILVAGDVIQYKKKGGGNHVLMYIGNGYLAQASRNDQFPRILKMRPPGKEMFNASNVARVQVIRNKRLASGN